MIVQTDRMTYLQRMRTYYQQATRPPVTVPHGPAAAAAAARQAAAMTATPALTAPRALPMSVVASLPRALRGRRMPALHPAHSVLVAPHFLEHMEPLLPMPQQQQRRAQPRPGTAAPAPPPQAEGGAAGAEGGAAGGAGPGPGPAPAAQQAEGGGGAGGRGGAGAGASGAGAAPARPGPQPHLELARLVRQRADALRGGRGLYSARVLALNKAIMEAREKQYQQVRACVRARRRACVTRACWWAGLNVGGPAARAALCCMGCSSCRGSLWFMRSRGRWCSHVHAARGTGAQEVRRRLRAIKVRASGTRKSYSRIEKYF